MESAPVSALASMIAAQGSVARTVVADAVAGGRVYRVGRAVHGEGGAGLPQQTRHSGSLEGLPPLSRPSHLRRQYSCPTPGASLSLRWTFANAVTEATTGRPHGCVPRER